MTTFIDPDSQSLRARLKMLARLGRIAFKTAFYTKRKSSSEAYVVLEVKRDGCRVERQGATVGCCYTLYFVAHLLQDEYLRRVRDHEGSSATLEHARSIINSQN